MAETLTYDAGTDTVTFTGAQNLSAAQLATISNTESWTIPTGSDFTLSDTVLANNPGLTFNFAGNGTLSTGEDARGRERLAPSAHGEGGARAGLLQGEVLESEVQVVAADAQSGRGAAAARVGGRGRGAGAARRAGRRVRGRIALRLPP